MMQKHEVLYNFLYNRKMIFENIVKNNKNIYIVKQMKILK